MDFAWRAPHTRAAAMNPARGADSALRRRFLTYPPRVVARQSTLLSPPVSTDCMTSANTPGCWLRSKLKYAMVVRPC
eukprot:scaffold74704_cov30-Tisochrysis_lutea.AAC.2